MAAWPRLAESGEIEAALAAFAQGIAVAEARVDVQAAKEMSVFARRLRNKLGEGGS